MAEAPTSKLEAVNILLKTIGESPINTLFNPGLSDATDAVATLDEISRVIQKKGWKFNTELEYPLAPDVDGFITKANNISSVFPTDPTLDITTRGNRLYDRLNRTYKFSQTLYFNMIVLLPFEELPEEARYYITIRAAKVFANRQLGDEATYSFTKEQEFDALSDLNKSHARKTKGSMLKGTIPYKILQHRNRGI